MDEIEDYILLTFKKREGYNQEFTLENKSSWQIYYHKTENCFVFRNLSGVKYTKTRNVEDFLKIWIDEMLVNVSPFGCNGFTKEAKINLYLQKQLYSVCLIDEGKEAPLATALRYVSILKDII